MRALNDDWLITGLVAAVVVVLAAAIGLHAACDGVRCHLDRTYYFVGTRGDTDTYRASTPVDATTRAIVGAVPPIARNADVSSEYLRYDDDIVVVSASQLGESTIRVEDLDEGYRSGRYRHLGPGFDPGSPAAAAIAGGPGDGK